MYSYSSAITSRAGEVYRLAEADVHFGELLPAKPSAVEQEEFEDRNRVGFQLEQLAKRVEIRRLDSNY